MDLKYVQLIVWFGFFVVVSHAGKHKHRPQVYYAPSAPDETDIQGVVTALALIKTKMIAGFLFMLMTFSLIAKLLYSFGVGCNYLYTCDYPSTSLTASPVLAPLPSLSSFGTARHDADYHPRSNIVGSTLDFFNVDSESCRQKFVCLLDNASLQNPLIGLTTLYFSDQIRPFRHNFVSLFPLDCDRLFPDCSRGRNDTSVG